jgi:hypothetical protein
MPEPVARASRSLWNTSLVEPYPLNPPYTSDQNRKNSPEHTTKPKRAANVTMRGERL